MNPLNSLAEYEEFIYALPQQYPALVYSTLIVARRGAATATVRGEVAFSGGVRLVVSERLMLDDGVLRIVSYGYEIRRGAEKFYWPAADLTRSRIPMTPRLPAHSRITSMFRPTSNTIVCLRRA